MLRRATVKALSDLTILNSPVRKWCVIGKSLPAQLRLQPGPTFGEPLLVAGSSCIKVSQCH
jgi:hypothetical protein